MTRRVVLAMTDEPRDRSQSHHRLVVMISQEQWQWLRAWAYREGSLISPLVRQVLDEVMRDQQRREAEEAAQRRAVDEALEGSRLIRQSPEWAELVELRKQVPKPDDAPTRFPNPVGLGR